ncbi:MAG TPA: SDR family oxidoreductase [Verrucomicrobiae bacterium]|jgi:NAD(P)-dependent dehydrogenase (short-subunit alcohol dehydrogenase family)
MDLGLRNKVALVTGGASGIGAAVVRMLISEGARVAFVDQNENAGAQICDELSASEHKPHFIKGDLTRETDCQRCVAETLNTLGGLDILINNAGVNDAVGLEASPDEFMSSLQKNLFHVFAVTHFAAEALKRARGVVINVSSKVAVTGQGHTSGYAAAKGGVNGLTREWAAALAPHGVRINCVVPAECDTPQYQKWFHSQPNPQEAKSQIEKLIPLGQRMTTPEEIAAAIVFLASPRSAHTTGQLLFVDGGYTHLDRALTQSRHEWNNER